MARERSNNNLKLWNEVFSTDPKYTKSDKSRGFEMTSIVPHYQIKKATEALGIFGTKFFRVVNEKFERMDIDDSTIMVLYTALLEAEYDGEQITIPLHASDYIRYKSSKGVKTEKEFAKKVATDALTKGLSKLGFNADVFLGKFDDKSYVKRQRRKYEDEHGEDD